MYYSVSVILLCFALLLWVSCWRTFQGSMRSTATLHWTEVSYRTNPGTSCGGCCAYWPFFYLEKLEARATGFSMACGCPSCTGTRLLSFTKPCWFQSEAQLVMEVTSSFAKFQTSLTGRFQRRSKSTSQCCGKTPGKSPDMSPRRRG